MAGTTLMKCSYLWLRWALKNRKTSTGFVEAVEGIWTKGATWAMAKRDEDEPTVISGLRFRRARPGQGVLVGNRKK